MSPHTDAGELLKAAQALVDEIAKRGTHNGWKRLDSAIQAASQGNTNCDCGFSAEVCSTNPCMRKKLATSGLVPDAKYPNVGKSQAASHGRAGEIAQRFADILFSQGKIEVSWDGMSDEERDAYLVAASTTSQGSAGGERSEVQSREAVARIIDPDAWLLYDNANALTKMQGPVSLWRVEPSLAKADAILSLGAAQASPASSVVEALQIAAGRIAGMGAAAARINLFGRLSEAYGAAEVEVKQLAKQIQSGEEIEDRNGIKHQFTGVPSLPSAQSKAPFNIGAYIDDNTEDQ
jgi:hypothetical protein